MLSNQIGSQVCAVIVTYGDRFRYLSEAVSAAFTTGVHRIVLVDNGCETNSRQAIQELVKRDKRIITISLPKNRGSARAYKVGIEHAMRLEDCAYLWLLDDDNVPMQGALSALLDQYMRKGESIPPERLALASFRPAYGIPEYRKNSFVGFHILDTPRRISKLLLVIAAKQIGHPPPAKPIEIGCSPYGGLFFSKELINAVGYPNEALVLYADDTEFTMRFIQNEVRLFLVPSSIVQDALPVGTQDVEMESGRRGSTMFDAITNLEEYRVYYGYRNSAYVGNLYKEGLGAIFYMLNKVVYLVALGVLTLFYGRWERFRLILRAIKDGESGRLGHVEEFSLPGS
jgi:GT2 family glycosyltransferase